MKLMFKQGSSCQEQLPMGYFMEQEAGGGSRSPIDESLTSLRVTLL